MIVRMNTEAKEQNGRLVDLALPQDMYDELLKWAAEFLSYPLMQTDGSFMIDGVKIHTGEND